MTQQIDPAKLRASAEHLEGVLNEYPDSDDVQSLLGALRPLLDDAKAGRISQPIDSVSVPGAYNFGDGLYVPYRSPDVGEAYAQFTTELAGGLSEQERRILARMQAARSGASGSDA